MKFTYTGPETLRGVIEKAFSGIKVNYGITFQKRPEFYVGIKDENFLKENGFLCEEEYFSEIDRLVYEAKTMKKEGNDNKIFSEKCKRIIDLGTPHEGRRCGRDFVTGEIIIPPPLPAEDYLFGKSFLEYIILHEIIHNETSGTEAMKFIRHNKIKEKKADEMITKDTERIMRLFRENIKESMTKEELQREMQPIYKWDAHARRHIKNYYKYSDNIDKIYHGLGIEALREGFAYAIAKDSEKKAFPMSESNVGTSEKDYFKSYEIFNFLLKKYPYQMIIQLAKEAENEAFSKEVNAIRILEKKSRAIGRKNFNCYNILSL